MATACRRLFRGNTVSGFSWVSAPLSECERNARIYAGEILVWNQLPPVVRLTGQIAIHARNHFGDDPGSAHRRMSQQALAELVPAFQKSVNNEPECGRQLMRMFEATGMDVGDNYDDSLVVRVQIPDSEPGLRRVAPLVAHRDTWGTNVMAQTNWWAPVFPITAERTMALFPFWFEASVANDSAGWDFAELRRRLKRDGSHPDYALLPTALETPDWCDALPVSIEPGALMAFSGAHLHASVPNTTDRIRFSFEIRTVNGADARAGRGAPNVDGSAPRTTWQLFRRRKDGRKLGDMV